MGYITVDDIVCRVRFKIEDKIRNNEMILDWC
ncbi:hypothetical protein Zm00014a_026307 [Zea mays]|jgi:hypothetical protein|uniref:Uncharacterized protein n=1 Tax=Zea mays TaxID=4577 RepID=A0A317Y7A7_MAIZE|nr:hypothetical protein Zm00014a_026307 [Zea mays]